jgi:hypothetical protein
MEGGTGPSSGDAVEKLLEREAVNAKHEYGRVAGGVSALFKMFFLQLD